MNIENLIQKAIEAKKNAYAPYSGFKVGAALLTEDEKVYTGCNIENSSFGVTNCAERTAFFKALSEGEKNFKQIAIVCGYDDKNEYCTACGVCLQVMAEFCPENFEIITAKNIKEYKVYKLNQLLPYAFNLKQRY